MKYIFSLLASGILLVSVHAHAQTATLNKNALEAVNAQMSIEKTGVKVIKDASVKEFDEPLL